MFRWKTTKEQLLEEKRKNAMLTQRLVEVTDALIEIAGLSAAQDDAIVELAEIIAESEV